MKMKFQHRLVYAFILMALITFVSSNIVFYFSFKNQVYNQLEGSLIEEAREFDAMIELRGDSLHVDLEREWTEMEHAYGSKSAIYASVVDTLFRTVEKSGNLGDAELQSVMQLESGSEIRRVDVSFKGSAHMGVVYPVQRNGRLVAYILLTTNLAQVTDHLKVWQETAGVSLAVMLLVSFCVAYVLGRRMVRPVVKIEKAAREINLDNLDKRITLHNADSEIESLIRTLNSLFERLSASFKQVEGFTSNVSHELRTPLTILRGNIEVALARERTTEEYVETLSALLDETISLSEIADNLLLLAGADSGTVSARKDCIRLRTFFDENKSTFNAICAERQHPLNIVVKSDLSILGDKTLLTQLFVNLISNAAKFSEEGDPIEILVNLKSDNGSARVHIAVKDSGVGIPAWEIPRVFERFYRVEKDRSRTTGGSGLGLAICEMITKVHGGSIEIESHAELGTTVNIYFPAYDAVEEAHRGAATDAGDGTDVG